MTAMSESICLRLHGYAVSNYFNVAHAALIEKGASFELVATRASQSPEFLATSPMGKIPVLETPRGWITETIAILEYLEDAVAGRPLYPQDAFLRARARQIINVVQMYVEAPARSLYAGVFMGGTNSAATIDAVRLTLDRATEALRRLITPQPYLVGDCCSYADLFAFHCLDVVDRLTAFVYERSIVAEVPGLQEWAAHMAGRESSRIVLDSFERAFLPYLVEKSAAYRVRARIR